jgi:hypothetical protein
MEKLLWFTALAVACSVDAVSPILSARRAVGAGFGANGAF